MVRKKKSEMPTAKKSASAEGSTAKKTAAKKSASTTKKSAKNSADLADVFPSESSAAHSNVVVPNGSDVPEGATNQGGPTPPADSRPEGATNMQELPQVERKSVTEVAEEILAARHTRWNSGRERDLLLTKAGYNPEEVRREVYRIRGERRTRNA